MKNAPIFLIGLFAALAISFGGIVLGSHAQLGSLAPYFDSDTLHPQRPSGIAVRGQLVYADLGCAACHTQQVRRAGYGNDQARGWGERQSVARDYIHQARPQLGASRIGPDLTNLGARKPQPPTAEALYTLLHDGSATHPSYRFLFETRQIAGESAMYSRKPAGGAPGTEIVPTERARSLVAYLQSLNTSFDYPEAAPYVAPAAAKSEGEQKK